LRSDPAKWWMAAASGANLALAAIIVASYGSGSDGTILALQATARVTFLWFVAAYTGGALSTLFYPRFQSLRRFGRELGLAFAAALLVHLSLVGWLCWIGKVPDIGVFEFFGPVAVHTYILAFFSFGNLHTVLGPKLWRLLRLIGMNIILFAFLRDFIRHPLHASYLPFVAMSVVAPALRLAAWMQRFAKSDSTTFSA
jgi:hypothetical protein